MSESRKILLMLLAFLWCCPKGNAQNKEFIPEVDVYSKLAPEIRFNFQVKETREAGDPTQAEIGPGFDFFLKPLVRLKNLTSYFTGLGEHMTWTRKVRTDAAHSSGL
jgi:hypothetical protein